MIDWFLSAGVALAHIALLLILATAAVRRLRMDIATLICAVFLIVWSELVCTALVLASFSLLGHRTAYVALSLLIAIAFNLALGRASHRSPLQPSMVPDGAAGEDDSRFNRGARTMFWLVIVAMVLPTAAICLRYDPNNYDSVAYRLPRAMLYIAQGNLAHLPIGDFRMVMYPFDTTLAYLATSIHNLAGRWMNLFGFVTWLIGGIAVWRFARENGAQKTAALFAATVFLSAPAVLVSAGSTNDDMIAGVPLLIGMLFAVRWWRSSHIIEAALAAMGFGLSAGSKLHYPFFAPVVALFCVVLFYRSMIAGRLLNALRRQSRQAALCAAILAVLVLPALVINIVQSGRATPEVANFQNKPFSPLIAGINTALFSANLFLSPIPDLNLDPDRDRRLNVYSRFNAWYNRNVFWWVSPDLDYSNEPVYRFEGVASNDAHYGVWEQSAWLGFVPWLLLLVPLLAWTARVRRGAPAAEQLRSTSLWLTATFFCWHLTRCFLLKYVGAAGIYYAYAAVFAAPALAWLWDAARPERTNLRIAVRIACLLLLAANIVSAISTFAFNLQRNIPDILQARNFRPRQGIVGPDLSQYLSGSRRTLVTYTQWELPLLDLLSVKPAARYATAPALGAAVVPNYDTSFMIQRIRSEYGETPIQFANDDRTRLSMLGTMTSVYGDQHAFGHSDIPVERSNEVIAEYDSRTDSGGLTLANGWAQTEHTHRWSDGRDSTIDFDLPFGKTDCKLAMHFITLGAQKVEAKLNGVPLQSFDANGSFPGNDITLPLPDSVLSAGDANHLTLHFDNARNAPGDNRLLALGLVNARLGCNPGLDPRPSQRSIFNYSAAGDADGQVFGKGWSQSERTHRWSDGLESEISFQLPAGRSACTFDSTVITAGSQTISTSLNGTPIDKTELKSWFPGANFRVALPDDLLSQTRPNEIVFHYDRTEFASGRNLAIGVVRAAVRCSKLDAAAAGLLPPLTSQGFAVLGVNQRRDSRNGLTSVALVALAGMDADERYNISLSTVSRAGKITPFAPPTPNPWGKFFDVSSAPSDGYLKIDLQRSDRPDITARAYLPITIGTAIPLDLRQLPDGTAP